MKLRVLAIGLATAGAGFLLVSNGGAGGSSLSAGVESERVSRGSADPYAALLKKLYRGNYKSPPTKSPRPAPEKKVWLISCGQSYSTCAVTIGGAKDAADAIGWKATIFDTKGDPSLAGTGIRQAIAAKVDGIFVFYVDCKYIKQPLAEAKKAGIPVVAAESFDCNEGTKRPPLFTHVVNYVQGNYRTWVTAWGAWEGDYIIAKKRGKAKTLFFAEVTNLGSKLDMEGARGRFAKCAGCKFYAETFPISAMGTTLEQRAGVALLKHPDVNSIGVSYDAVLLSGVLSAVESSGRRDLLVMSGEGGPAGAAVVRSGRAVGGVGAPTDWEGFAGIDALNRLFGGQRPANSGIGLQVYDAQHNLPPRGGYLPPMDFRSIYKKAWGVTR